MCCSSKSQHNPMIETWPVNQIVRACFDWGFLNLIYRQHWWLPWGVKMRWRGLNSRKVGMFEPYIKQTDNSFVINMKKDITYCTCYSTLVPTDKAFRYVGECWCENWRLARSITHHIFSGFGVSHTAKQGRQGRGNMSWLAVCLHFVSSLKLKAWLAFSKTII